MELCKGARDKKGRDYIVNAIQRFSAIHLNGSISKAAQGLVQKYHLSHKIQIPDALIAATALEKEVPLFTLNFKDFDYLPGLKLLK